MSEIILSNEATSCCVAILDLAYSLKDKAMALCNILMSDGILNEWYQNNQPNSNGSSSELN